MTNESSLLLVGHGDQVGERPNGALADMAAALGRRFGLAAAHALLKGEPSVADALSALPPGTRPIVHPAFMSDGYFTRVKLPKALEEAGVADARRLVPLGLDPLLVDLADRRLEAAAARHGLRREAASVLLVAHGSRSGEPASKRAGEAFAAALFRRGWPIETAFIEEEPFVEPRLDALRPALVLGFFAGLGTHAVNDVAGRVAARPFVREVIPAIGVDPEIAEIVAVRIAEAIGPP